MVFASKSRQSGKSEASAPSGRTPAAARPERANPRWSRLATRVDAPVVQTKPAVDVPGDAYQMKLTVGQPGDIYEQEADAAASRISAGQPVGRISRLTPGGFSQTMNEPTEEEEPVQGQLEQEEYAGTLQRQPADAEEEEQVRRQSEGEEEETIGMEGLPTAVQTKCRECEEEEKAQRRKGTDQSSANNIDTTKAERAMVRSGAGSSLSPMLQTQMEESFGADFSGVRVHTGAPTNEAAQALNARAFTHGSSIYLARGEAPTDRGLMAHELTHVIQQSAGTTGQQPRIQRRRCASDDEPDSIVEKHSVDPKKIEKPGDSVDFSVRFKCEVRGFRSKLEDSGGTSLNMDTYPGQSSFPRSSYSRSWDGKRGYSNVGTYMVDDGHYRHRLDEVLYAYRYNPDTGSSDNLYASGDDLTSPDVEVATRAGAFSDYSSNHYSAANIDVVARIIRSEMGIGNEAEQRAIAWAVRNQMVRLNTRSAIAARDHFSDAHGQAATDDARHLAQEVLAVDMGNDTTGGAIKWFSPRSMPSEGESCSDFECGGGLITVADTGGTNHRKYAPTFHNHMTYVAVAGVREWHARFYKL